MDFKTILHDHKDDGRPRAQRSSSSADRPVKRRRVEIPIWARPAKKPKPLPKYNTMDMAIGTGPRASGAKAPIASLAKVPSEVLVEEDVKPTLTPDPASAGPLEDLEESFRGLIPHEELTKQVCDFLFQYVVVNESVGTNRPGEPAKVQGQLEIEAKIGTIVDKNTHERLRLPVMSESVLVPDFDVGFESMMTEQQHESFNNLLNGELMSSRRPSTTGPGEKAARPRAPIVYEHLHEIDTFYELPEEEMSNLPKPLRDLLKSKAHPARKATVRVTTDKKKGNITAKIVKARISDLHVVSPLTTFDWRVSVNLEANWDGDVEALIRASDGSHSKSHPDRHKDRMSYTHQFCQIDLTQVKSEEANPAKSAKPSVSKTHELEVELDSSAIREQGRLVQKGLDNKYEKLVMAFVNNVRTLIRGVQ